MNLFSTAESETEFLRKIPKTHKYFKGFDEKGNRVNLRGISVPTNSIKYFFFSGLASEYELMPIYPNWGNILQDFELPLKHYSNISEKYMSMLYHRHESKICNSVTSYSSFKKWAGLCFYKLITQYNFKNKKVVLPLSILESVYIYFLDRKSYIISEKEILNPAYLKHESSLNSTYIHYLNLKK